MKRKTLLIDMDLVIADISGQYIKWYKEKTGVHVSDRELLGKSEEEAFPNPALIKEFLRTPGFFRHADVIPCSQEVIMQLNEIYDIYIVSAAMEFPQSLIEKYEWLQEHFPFLSWKQFIFCGSKKNISGDYMIDDHVKNLKHFRGEKLLFTAPHNTIIDIIGYTRVNNWIEIKHLLIGMNGRTANPFPHVVHPNLHPWC